MSQPPLATGIPSTLRVRDVEWRRPAARPPLSFIPPKVEEGANEKGDGSTLRVKLPNDTFNIERYEPDTGEKFVELMDVFQDIIRKRP